jgi:hypothetical protein
MLGAGGLPVGLFNLFYLTSMATSSQSRWRFALTVSPYGLHRRVRVERRVTAIPLTLSAH